METLNSLTLNDTTYDSFVDQTAREMAADAALFAEELAEELADLPNNSELVGNVAEVVKEKVPLVKTAEQPAFANTIEECTDPEKMYVLPDGYIYAYGVNEGKQYTNLLQTLTDADGNIYNGLGYKDNTALYYSNGAEQAGMTDHFATGFIPMGPTDVVRIRLAGATKNSNTLVLYYNSSKGKIGDVNAGASGAYAIDENGDIVFNETGILGTYYPAVAYVRFSLYVGAETPDFSKVIVTVNEEIIEGVIEGFFSTGLVYQPMDCEDRLLGLEDDVSGLKEEVTELKETGGGGNVTFDYTAYGLPELALTGNVSGMTKENAVTLDYVYGDRSGTCTVKWQGASSLSYPKKNYTVKFDNAFEAVEGWGEQKKYCFKANYIDHSHARNIVSAKLWKGVVRSRKPQNTTLEALPNCGAIDGFPCVITINGKYQGLYTFNIPKDGWMFGMGNGTNEAILCAENNSSEAFENGVEVGNHFSLEYVSDEDNAGWVTTSLNRMINACNNSNGTDLDTTVAQYLDIESAIDYYIFATLIDGLDVITKNYLLVTYDGTKWFFSAYDLDSTYGLYWNGQYFNGISTYGASYYRDANKIIQLIVTHKKDALKSRYAQLRKGALSEANVITAFSNFMCKIPERIYLSDTEVWPLIPSSAASNLAQLTAWYQTRAKIIDAQMEAL